MVTNRLWCVPVLVLLFTLNNLVTSRYLSRMKKEISDYTTSTNTTDRHSTNITGPETVRTTTVDHLKSMSAQTIEVKTDRPDLNVSVTNMDHQNISDLSHTQKNEGNETSGNHFKGTESVTVSQPTGNENTSYTQLPKRNDSIGHVSLAGSSAPTFPALLSKVTEMHTTAATTKIPSDKSTTSTAPHSTASRTFKNQTSTTEKAPLCFTASPQRDRLVSHCLIAIASMAALTTIFIISTICLATKLSRYRYRHKAHLLQETEMVCISALINDTDHPVPRPRHPKSNGALIPNTEDGDTDGDNLTLNSFLPDNDGPL